MAVNVCTFLENSLDLVRFRGYLMKWLVRLVLAILTVSSLVQAQVLKTLDAKDQAPAGFDGYSFSRVDIDDGQRTEPRTIL
jgi:hypothetical protein